MKFAQMNVLLTGATGGIGSELATLLASGGAALLLNGRAESRLAVQCAHLRHSARHVEAVAGDLATPAGREAVVRAASVFPGGINVLVNNAGVNRFGRFARQDADSLERLVTLNFVAPMLLTRDLLPMLLAREAAVVANIGSIVGSIGVPGQAAYAGSKFALHGFSEALRRELAGSPVRIVYVAPRSTDTRMNDVALRLVNAESGNRIDAPSAVARQIADAIAGTSRERFIGWPERLFVKVNALFPGLVDRALRRQNQLVDRAPFDDQPVTRLKGVES
jgi:short-subunit dehydrogenase